MHSLHVLLCEQHVCVTAYAYEEGGLRFCTVKRFEQTPEIKSYFRKLYQMKKIRPQVCCCNNFPRQFPTHAQLSGPLSQQLFIL